MVDVILKSGNIFNSEADALVVTVNCVGFMGKGMALECALRFPDVESGYKASCKRNEVRIGEISWESTADGKVLALFPTKDDYKNPSRMHYITDGLASLIRDIDSRGLASIALPKLGTELGGLDWRLVEEQILRSFEGINIDLEIWSFDPQLEDNLTMQIINKIEANFEEAVEVSGVQEVILHRLMFASQNNTFAGVADLLRVQGVGKQSVKKLITWVKNQPVRQSTLFD